MSTRKTKHNLAYFLNLPYEIIIEPQKEEDEKWYIAYAKELGKYACYGKGDTPEEALKNFKEEKNAFITYLYENGKTIPLPEEKKEEFSGIFTIRIPRHLHVLLHEQAQREGVSLNAWINHLLSFHAGLKKGENRIVNKLKTLITKLEAMLPGYSYPVKYKERNMLTQHTKINIPHYSHQNKITTKNQYYENLS